MTGGLCQTPTQFAQYLIFFHDKNIKTFLELGTFTGFTSVIICAYLLRFGLEIYNTYDIFHICKLQHLFIEFNLPITYKVRTPEFIEVDNINKYYDVVFIDSDHSYSGVSNAFTHFGKNCKYVTFHDINDYFCVGVVAFWKELKTTYNKNNYYEIIDHPNNFRLMGFGIMEHIPG
jgi:hypothetical protein